MHSVRLVHWNVSEAEQRAEFLRGIGYEVSCELPRDQGYFRELGKDPPAAVVIDLSRLPSQGRDVALALRSRKATRMAVLVFVGGEPDRIEGIRKLLPDVVFTSWDEIRDSLKKAIASPPQNPVRPRSVLEGYSGRPLPKKLGIKPGFVVSLVNSPPGFGEILSPLPDDVRLRSHDRGPCNLMICFVRSGKDLSLSIHRYAARTDLGSIWIAWQKKASGANTDLNENVVRKAGLAAGLVDYKICAIDATWSGLLFTRRKRSHSKDFT